MQWQEGISLISIRFSGFEYDLWVLRKHSLNYIFFCKVNATTNQISFIRSNIALEGPEIHWTRIKDNHI